MSLLLLSWVLYVLCYIYLPLAEKLPKYLGLIHNAIMAPLLAINTCLPQNPLKKNFKKTAEI